MQLAGHIAALVVADACRTHPDLEREEEIHDRIDKVITAVWQGPGMVRVDGRREVMLSAGLALRRHIQTMRHVGYGRPPLLELARCGQLFGDPVALHHLIRKVLHQIRDRETLHQPLTKLIAAFGETATDDGTGLGSIVSTRANTGSAR